MPRTVLVLIVGLALVYLVLCALLFLFQRSMIYLPQPGSRDRASNTIALPVDGADVLVTVRPQDGPNALVYFGGNAEDVSASLPLLAAAFPDRALFLMHYRGYGGSSGKPSEAALVADALVLFDKVRSEHSNIAVVGRSLGSGVAVHLASLRPVARLVLVTPYNSLVQIAAHAYPLFPVRWLLRDRFESWKYAARVEAPTLIVMAEHDEVIPPASTEALFGHFRPGRATLKVIPHVGHNTISESSEYIPLLRGVP